MSKFIEYAVCQQYRHSQYAGTTVID